MGGKLTLALLALSLLLPTSAAAAQPSPSMQFAYNVASARVGQPDNCTSMDLRVIPDAEFDVFASPAPVEPEPCYVYMARWLAAPRSFGNACRTFYNVLMAMQGIERAFPAMPVACRSRVLFLLNHPDYLDRF